MAFSLVPRKSASWSRLFDFLEEHLDSPSCEVKVADGIWRPFELICDEAHLGGFSIAQDTCRDQPEIFWKLFKGIFSCKPDEALLFYGISVQKKENIFPKKKLHNGRIRVHALLGAASPPR